MSTSSVSASGAPDKSKEIVERRLNGRTKKGNNVEFTPWFDFMDLEHLGSA